MDEHEPDDCTCDDYANGRHLGEDCDEAGCPVLCVDSTCPVHGYWVWTDPPVYIRPANG